MNNQNSYNRSTRKLLFFINDSILNKYTNNGMDERYIKLLKEDDCSLDKIKEQLEKKKLLYILQSKDVSILTKLSLLKTPEQDVKPLNIFSGGLLNEFDI
jgi:hypothetical protein